MWYKFLKLRHITLDDWFLVYRLYMVYRWHWVNQLIRLMIVKRRNGEVQVERCPNKWYQKRLLKCVRTLTSSWWKVSIYILTEDTCICICNTFYLSTIVLVLGIFARLMLRRFNDDNSENFLLESVWMKLWLNEYMINWTKFEQSKLKRSVDEGFVLY